MSIERIEKDFHEKVSAQVRLVAEGVGRYRVLTPFMFDDGDHLVIVLKKENSQWILSDEAHTYMHLTYDIKEEDLHKGARQKIISNALLNFQVDGRDGELMINVQDERYGDALCSFVRSILEISNVPNERNMRYLNESSLANQ